MLPSHKHNSSSSSGTKRKRYGNNTPRKQLATTAARKPVVLSPAELEAEQREQDIQDRKDLRRHLSTRRSDAVFRQLEAVEQKEREQLDALCAESYKFGHKSGYRTTEQGFTHHHKEYRKAIQDAINHYAILKNKLHIQLGQIDTALGDGQFICPLCRHVQSNSSKKDGSDSESIHLGSSSIKIEGNVCCCQDEEERCKFCQVSYNHNETVPPCAICCSDTYMFKQKKHRMFEGCGCNFSPSRDQCQDCHDVFCAACAEKDYNLVNTSHCGTLCESCQAEHYDGFRCHTCPAAYNR